MSILVARSFYLLTAVNIIFHLPYILSRQFDHAQFVSFAYFLNFFSNPVLIIFILSIFLLVSLAFCLWRLDRTSRFLVALLGSVLLHTAFSFGKINRTQHLWILSSYLMIFFDVKKSFSQKPNALIYDLIQSILLATYFVSGLWKLRGWIEHSDTSLREGVLNFIALSVGEGNGPHVVLYPLLMENTWILVVGFILALIFQLSTPVAIFQRQYRSLWGLFACIFHFLTGYVMGVWFNPQLVTVLFFLIFVPMLEKDLKQKSF